jgi:hypothetical protein
LNTIERSLRDAPLSLTKAESIVREFAALTEDSADSFFFYVLKHVFSEIANSLDGEAVSVDRHEDLTEGTRVGTLRLLENFRQTDVIPFEELQKLVESHTVKNSVFRAS